MIKILRSFILVFVAAWKLGLNQRRTVNTMLSQYRSIWWQTWWPRCSLPWCTVIRWCCTA